MICLNMELIYTRAKIKELNICFSDFSFLFKKLSIYIICKSAIEYIFADALLKDTFLNALN